MICEYATLGQKVTIWLIADFEGLRMGKGWVLAVQTPMPQVLAAKGSV